jgi:rhodanese-related sulfurtransferase
MGSPELIMPKQKPSLTRGLVVGIIVVGMAVPLVLYGLGIGRAPSVLSSAARQLLQERKAVLVDVGTAPDLAIYLTNAVQWPLSSCLQARTARDLPLELRGQKLLLICTAGVRSAQAVLHLRDIGVDAWSVRGGAQQYICAVPGCSRSVLFAGDPLADVGLPAFRQSPLHEQWALVLSFFGIKGVYSLLALGIVIMLWRRPEPDLSALRWSMVFFFIGEACCFFNVMAFFEDSLLLEHLHSVGMVLSLGFATFGLLEGMDARLVHYSGDSRCAMMGLCRSCDKRVENGCALRKLFLWLIPATALLAVMPMCSGFRETAYNTRVLGLLHSYRHPVLHQIYELRCLPIMAVVLLAGCFLVLWRVERRSVDYSKVLFSAALGAAGFGWFRLVLVASFVDNQVWFVAWEETTELLFVGLAIVVLILFEAGLTPKAPPAKAEVCP